MDAFFRRDHDLPSEGSIAIYWQKCMCPCYGDNEGMKHKFKAQYCTVANSLSAIALQPYKAVCRLK
jgi:hypothetical protein